VVQAEYNKILLDAGNRILDFDQKCQTEWYTNAQINTARMIEVNASAGFSNEDMTNDLYA
jgi:hypothetical protein